MGFRQIGLGAAAGSVRGVPGTVAAAIAVGKTDLGVRPAIGSIQVGSLSQLENDCRFEDLTAYPVLNPGPLKWTGTMTCGDFPLIDVGHRGADHWSKSQSDHNAGLLAKIGDVLSVRLFLEWESGMPLLTQFALFFISTVGKVSVQILE